MAQDRNGAMPTSSSGPSGPSAPGAPFQPWPARVRRLGFPSEASGGLAGVLRVLPLIKEGLDLRSFMQVLQDANPEHAQYGSAPSALLRQDLDVCTQNNAGLFALTPRGQALLDTSDPDVLADHLLTTMYGPDHLLKALEQRPMHLHEVVEFLSRLNPGDEVRNRRLLKWLHDLGVIELGDEKIYELTERGKRWAALITWTPETKEAL